MSTQSLSELLTWLEQTPRTLGWDAIIAYDRDKANSLLIQDYITRFNTSSYLPALTRTVPTGDTVTEHIYDYTLDCPRLSFENADMGSSLAKLTMKVIGGMQLTVDTSSGVAVVTRVSSIDALDGPKLNMDVELQATPGTTNSLGQVKLDLSKASHFYLTFADDDTACKEGGDYFAEVFKQLPAAQQTVVIGEVAKSPAGACFKPAKFYLRTHSAENAKVRGAANVGDGAILLFLAMSDRPEGVLPVDDKAFKYLIPNEGGYSAAALFSHDFIMAELMAQSCRQMDNSLLGFHYTMVPDEESNDPAYKKLLGLQGGYITANRTLKLGDRTLTLFTPMVAIAGVGAALVGGTSFFSAQRLGQKIKLEWKGGNAVKGLVLYLLYGGEISATAYWNWQPELDFTINIGSGEVSLKPTAASPSPKLELDSYITYPGVIEKNLDELKRYLIDMIDSLLQTCIERFGTATTQFNTLINSLLFRDASVVKWNTVHFPGDLALFGTFNAASTAFTISPLEKVVGAQSVTTFQATPAVANIIWSVEAIAGDSGDIGKIDSKTGRYEAPAKNTLSAAYKRIRINARLGSYSSSALVTVVSRDITVNPIVQICGAWDNQPGSRRPSKKLSAGSLTAAPLIWSLKSLASGASLTQADDGYLYNAGPKKNDAVYTLDEILVSQQGGNPQSAFIVLQHDIAHLNIQIDSAHSSDTHIQLVARSNTTPLDPALFHTIKWQVLAGAGQLEGGNSNTVKLTVDPAAHFKFSVIHVKAFAAIDYINFEGLLILPVPLIELAHTNRALTERA